MGSLQGLGAPATVGGSGGPGFCVHMWAPRLACLGHVLPGLQGREELGAWPWAPGVCLTGPLTSVPHPPQGPLADDPSSLRAPFTLCFCPGPGLPTALAQGEGDSDSSALTWLPGAGSCPTLCLALLGGKGHSHSYSQESLGWGRGRADADKAPPSPSGSGFHWGGAVNDA